MTEPGDYDGTGTTVLSWSYLCENWAVPARKVGMRRQSLASPSQAWLDWLDEVDRLAIVGVSIDGPAAIADLTDFVVEPATRRGIELTIEADKAVEDLDPAAFVEPQFGYAYSLERLHWRLHGNQQVRQPASELPDTSFDPDKTQAAAVDARDGVVQIIAPAGSGKTTVLVERVRELRRRGARAETIACLTFNRAAKEELAERLAAAGVGNADAFTFHGLGRRILIDAGVLSKKPRIGGPTIGQWRRLSALAMNEVDDGVWIPSSDASEKLSQIKLGFLQTPEEYETTVASSDDPEERTMAALYRHYEEMQRQQGRVDFDDLVLKAVRLLREDPQVRGQWQAHYHHVLVDEYQDIEPAQELIVRIIAAPHDQLFCVGDEDQTLYAFRRASVERIINLDCLYPTLQRVALGINYRCPPEVVEVSRSLIERNVVRFPKTIEPHPRAPDSGAISPQRVTRQAESAGDIAKLLKTKQRGEITVLGRTTDALRPTALACADLGVPIDGNDKLFKPTGARLAIQRHLSLALSPAQATIDLVRQVCQTPGRSLNRGAEQTVVQRLQAGLPFEAAFEGVPAPRRGNGSLLAPGELFALLAACEAAGEAIALLRGPGGLDSWFEEDDDLGGLDQFECEVLEQAQRDAADQTPAQFLAALENQAKQLEAIRDEENGIELLTIHGSKGRQWPHVVVVACDEGTLPHARAVQVGPSEIAKGEGMEGERRLGYVAFTRSQQRLDIHYDAERPSPFLEESSILETERREPRVPPPLPQPDKGSSPHKLRGLLRKRG